MRLFRGAIGTNNVDHCTRLCHSTSVAAMQRALNTSAASGSMREIEAACDVIFIAGANTTESHPVFGAAIKRAHEHGATLIVADPRRTELAGRADIHLQMQPGTDVALCSAMLPVRGQNNVQGASDVGAIPFVYTDYRSVKDPAIRAEYANAWGVAPETLSLKEGLMVTEVVKPESGVRGMYIMGENPIISDPDIAHAEHWFRELEFLAVHDLFLPEPARYADVVLPGSSFAEKTGTFVNPERRTQLSHRAVDPPGQARADLEILIELSNRLGLPTPHQSADEVMQEIAQVTPSWRGVTHARLEGAGLQYPVPTADHPGTAFLFAERFPTADGRARFVPVEYTDPVELPDETYPFVMNTGRQLYH